MCAPSPPTLEGNPDGDWDGDGDGDGDRDGDMQHGDDCDASEDKSMPAAVVMMMMMMTTTSYAIHTLICKEIVFSKRPTPIVGLSART